VSVRVEVSPRMLEWARARSGIGAADWDRRFPRYESWLIGATTPTFKQLEAFADKTHTPFGFLLLDEPPVETVPIADFRTVRDQPAGTGLTANLLDVIYACERRQEWYRENQLLEGEEPLAFVGTASVGDGVEHAAEQLRAVLDWTAEHRTDSPTPDSMLTALRERAESAGVLVMVSGIVGSNTHRKLDPQEFRGFVLADSLAPLVFVNGADAKAAQVFTLVHELAHLALGETGISDLEPESLRTSTVERWCNRVAAEFLVPMAEFRSRVDDTVDLRSQLRPLAEHFRVSTQVILGQFREAALLSWEGYLDELAIERQRAAASRTQRSSGGNYYNTRPVQVSKRFASALIASAKEGRTPYTRAFRLLDLKKEATFDRLAERLGVV